VHVAELHGDLSQGVRERNLASFATGSVMTLVATDIAARGIHVDGIDLVIHADPPTEHKAYVHRSGRTARAGAAGTSVTVQTTAQAPDVTAMMRRASVEPLHASVRPDSALLRSIAGPRAARATPPARPARPVAAAAAPATGHSAAAISASFRGSRRR
jgi:superfamily II DNA/RNA helicase